MTFHSLYSRFITPFIKEIQSNPSCNLKSIMRFQEHTDVYKENISSIRVFCSYLNHKKTHFSEVYASNKKKSLVRSFPKS